ncbi:MAG: VWA domain-containing protein [Acidobacteria bacterium]|nr:VWA domain-containing protein [Acidobacteriota bacterium]
MKRAIMKSIRQQLHQFPRARLTNQKVSGLPRRYEGMTNAQSKERRWIGWLVAGGLLILGLLPIGPAAQTRPQQSETEPAQVNLTTDLVTLSVSVTDGFGRPATGFTRDAFQVFENGVEQEIAFFAPDDSPLAVGLVLDSSGSMGRDYKMERARAAALHFVRTSHPDDEAFLIDFDSQAKVTLDFTSDLDGVAAALLTAEAGGRTALYDAVYLALEKLNGYRTQRRKVILLITDGMDTASRRLLRETRELVRESDVQIYAIGILGSDMRLSSTSTIEDFAEVTGGLAFFPSDPRQMVQICYGVAVQLHQQYSLGYRPTNDARDGQWRKVKVKIKPRKGRPPPPGAHAPGILCPGLKLTGSFRRM